ncbi:MAG: NifB/NifX family molybdenum-iron cluster-binding protein [Candidatus Colwellbacteria bacterium]|jgi:predicted Fe-Mo cluster-binding NifX family protein|nr:NifB/NifX family molybdenum-iron cluster-binding protein [Candidatus Colwellbacteria bacterium]MCK9497792.1 NifB/NifX family molybdenum-iron cluster-binding protein [Candidatus Colwellbacteria bacterium]
MKIVVPTNDDKGLDSNVAEHFGRCATYTFLNENGEVIEVAPNTSEHGGESGLPPELMRDHGANILLCKGIGSRAIGLCKEFGIDVYVCPSVSVKDIFEKWKKGELKKASMEDSC